ncbi:MAG: TIGR03668 family PPOX class F420-dependent oxidoreductase [Actinomycetota bacterium]|nr:TIGR03668 family PPOX class F420-dependent oxidoreductase [Actinomycetota bacterium]
MRFGSDWARERFALARVARLATIGPAGAPHLVPIVFATAADVIYTAVDAKPKSTLQLRRLDNIAVDPGVSVLVDHYDDDWEQLWWARADGRARLLGASAERDTAISLLTDRYPQYSDEPPPGLVIAVEVLRWSGWAAR